MKFSIAIPSYKSYYLDEAIKSVVSQTYSNWELIIVDDHSPEDIPSIVKPYLKDSRVKFYRNDINCGAEKVVDNWNICLSYCTGEYVICMGDDDRLMPCCLDEFRKLIKKYPEVNVYHARTEIIDENGKVTEILNTRPEREDVLSMMKHKWEWQKQFIGDFCYQRNHLVSQGGYYILPFAWGSDDITAFRAAYSYGIANFNKIGFQYRENNKSLSLSFHEIEKVEAVRLQKQWYTTILDNLRIQNKYSKEELDAATDSMNRFVNELTCYHIYRDLKHGNACRYLNWLRIISKYNISIFTLTKLYLKSFIYNV